MSQESKGRTKSNRPRQAPGSKIEAYTLVEESVGNIFGRTLLDISRAMLATHNEPMTSSHSHPVDIEMKFKSVSIDKGGLLFNRKLEESRMEFTLSTRILPPN